MIYENLRERQTAIKVAILKRGERYDFGVRTKVAQELIELGFDTKTGESKGLTPTFRGNLEAVEGILQKFEISEQGLAAEILELICG